MLDIRSYEDIERLVIERACEGMRLEFKQALPDSGRNDDIARAIASFANAEGGVLVYGIREDKETNSAQERTPVVLAKAAERITQVAGVIDEPVALEDVRPIGDPDHEGLGYVVVVVPRGPRAPHLVDGVVYGRTPRGRTTLGRRAIGELFARSPGFAEEFRLRFGKPGRVTVRGAKERVTRPNAVGDGREYALVFENDGETDVRNVNWAFAERGGRTPPTVPHDLNPFPVATMQAHGQLRVPVFLTMGRDLTPVVRVRWQEREGAPVVEHEYQITW